MTIVRDNERSHAIDLIGIINEVAKDNSLKIKTAGGERTISTSKDGMSKRMFPDVVLYEDENKTRILQGWELKLPDTLITDETFIKDAQRKADALNLNSCFIWNFTSGVLYIKDENGGFEVKKQWNETSHIKNRKDVAENKEDWQKLIKTIIIEINEFFITGDIKGAGLGEIITNSVIPLIIFDNKDLVGQHLKEQVKSNSIIGAYIDQWWKEVESDYCKDESNKYNAYAKMILINWTNRIIFANLIKKYHNDAMEVDKIIDGVAVDEANNIFKEITQKCDFYTIFAGIEYCVCIPQSTWNILIELNVFFINNGVSELEQSIFQEILERTVAISKRELAGQYTTPPILAKILAGIVIVDSTKPTIDPCCGTGTISKAILEYKKLNGINIDEIVDKTWSSDKHQYPLQIANISLTSHETIKLLNKVFRENAFKLYNTKLIVMTNPVTGEDIEFDLPKFDYILSNLPFVGFETIDEENSLTKDIKEKVKNETGIELTDKSDVYCYLIFSLYEILVENGRAGFIISNSWLGTIWGKKFFEALKWYYNVEQIHISGEGRWFENADVVTTIIILSKKQEISNPNKSENVLFYRWNNSISEIENDDNIKNDIINCSKLNKGSKYLSLSTYNYGDIETILGINVSINSLFYGVDWLKDIKSKGFLVLIKEVFKVTRGERRGWDEMFYPEAGHNIETEYIQKVLKNAKNVDELIATPDSDAFCCPDDIPTLKKNGKNGALNWIEKFESTVNGKGHALPNVLERKNLEWYEMDTNTVDIFTMMNPSERLFFGKFDEPAFINQRLIGLNRKCEDIDIELNHALLNSILGIFFIEACGFGRGLGVLDINKESIANSYMLDAKKVKNKDRELIISLFKSILNRKIKTTSDELECDTRYNFDIAVLKAFEIEQHYYSIKASLISMQKSRLSVRKKQKIK